MDTGSTSSSTLPQNLSFSSNDRASAFRKRENTNISFCRELKEKLLLLKNKCYTCFLFKGGGRNLINWHNTCPTFKFNFPTGCFKCGGKNHAISDCPFSLLKNYSKGISTSRWLNGSKSFCYFCTCPKEACDSIYHSGGVDGSFNRSCFNVLRFIYQSLGNRLVLNEVRHSFLELKNMSIPSHHFRSWCFQDSSVEGLMNMTVLFSKLYDIVLYCNGIKNIDLLDQK